MHIPLYLVYTVVVLVFWGACGIFQKLATNRISAESSLIWLIVGFLLIQPFVVPHVPLARYHKINVVWGLMSGLLSNIGAWGLYAAMKHGGKASIVAVICAMYPLVVVFLQLVLFHDTITLIQGAGIVCAIIAGVLLSL